MAEVDEPGLGEFQFDAESEDVVARGEGDGLDEFDLTPAFLAWVEEHLSVVEYTHSEKSTATWCPEWWKHPEVIERLRASFEAWEQARQDAPTRLSALSDWWLTHWDRHAAILFDAKAGPFRKCDRNLSHLHDSNVQDEQRVPYYAPPADWQR